MTVPLTPSEIVRALVTRGVPQDRAERAAGFLVPNADLDAAADHLRPAIHFPLYLTLPWSALCSDNTREKASLTWREGKPIPRKILDGRYAAARDKTRAIAQNLVAGAVNVMVPLSLHARVFVPDERLHDVCNFAKCCHDALEGIVYANDKWLHRTTWERAGVDVDAPRAEIEIRPMAVV